MWVINIATTFQTMFWFCRKKLKVQLRVFGHAAICQLSGLFWMIWRLWFLHTIVWVKKIFRKLGGATNVTKCSRKNLLWKPICWFIQEKGHLFVINVTSHFQEKHIWKGTSIVTWRKRTLCVINVRKDFQKEPLWNLTS